MNVLNLYVGESEREHIDICGTLVVADNGDTYIIPTVNIVTDAEPEKTPSYPAPFDSGHFEPDREMLIGKAVKVIPSTVRPNGLPPERESMADFNCPVCCAGIPFDALNEDVRNAPRYCSNCGCAFAWKEFFEIEPWAEWFDAGIFAPNTDEHFRLPYNPRERQTKQG